MLSYFGDNPSPSLVSGADKAVAVAGTLVQLSATSIPCRSVIIQALPGNTGVIYVGGSNVDSTHCHAELDAGDIVTIPIDDVSKIYLDASVGTESVHWGYLV